MSGSLIYASTLLAISALLAGLIVIGLQRREAPGARAICLLLGLAACWCTLDALWQLAEAPLDKLWLNQTAYIIYAFIPVAWIVLAYDYRSMLGRRRRVVAALCIVPALTVVCAWSYPSQHLFWTSSSTRQLHALSVHSSVSGPWWWVHVGYSYALTLVGAVMLMKAFFARGAVPRAQSICFVAGAAIAWVFNGLFIANMTPLSGLDITPLGFSLSVGLMLAALMRFRLLDIVPVAYDRVIQHTPNPVVVLDSAGRILAANTAAQATFLLSPHTLGQLLDFTVVPSHKSSPIHFNRDSPDGLQFVVQVRGERREFVLSRTPLTNRHGRALGLLFVMNDLTVDRARQRELEAALRRQSSLVAEAAAALRAKSEFLAVMSHEIRTPLNVIIGSASLLAEDALSCSQREYAETIHASGHSLLAILNDILDLSEIDAGRMTLEEVDFDLRSVIEDVVEIYAPPAAKRGLQFVLDCEAGISGTYRGAPARLRQVLLNLVGNAVKFTEVGSVSVYVRRAEGSQSVEFSVTDTGIGVEPSAQEHLFDVFRQADSSTTRRFGGTGLGLAIARRLVHMMGGTMGCETSPGKGSRFWFEVPLTLVSERPAPKLQGLCVLMSSSSAAVARLRVVLQLLGYESELARNAQSVLADPPVLLIVDPNWPGFASRGAAASFLAAAREVESMTLAALLTTLTVPLEAWSQVMIPLREPWLLRRLKQVLGSSPARAPEVLDIGMSYASFRLLLAEDNPLNRTVARHMLRSLGCAIDEAATGLEAVDRAQNVHYDLILMDLQMPGMDGFEATRRIRLSEGARGTARTPIVAFSAGTFLGEKDLAAEAGMDGFLSKPVEKEQLLSVCVRWFAAADQRSRGAGI
jgi:signal transduction histidine kinase/ActR/RegA family two-component response regulator